MSVSAAIAGLALAAAWSLRVAWADYAMRQGTVDSVQHAMRAIPDQAACYDRLALLVDAEDPARATQALERAAGLNPWDIEARIHLGLRREARGDLAGAERELLEAARFDRQYLPRWTLANYYFRRGDRERFWLWAKASAEMVYGDGMALFRLCGNFDEDGRLIDRLEIRRPEVRANYLAYLLRQGRVDLVMPAVRKLLTEGRDADTPLLLDACDRLLEQVRVSDALEIRDRLAERPDRGGLLTNAAFRTAPTGRGFDWRLADVTGVTAAREDGRGGLRITFSGRQPENCEILAQPVPLPENSDFELAVRYRTEDIAARSGLSWRITDAASGRGMLETDSFSSDAGEWRTFRFRTPPGCTLGRLALVYRRGAGTTRIEGYLTIGEVLLRPVATPPKAPL